MTRKPETVAGRVARAGRTRRPPDNAGRGKAGGNAR